MFIIGEGPISLEDYKKIVIEKEQVDIHEQGLKAAYESFNFLNDFHKDKIVYGINTGLGPMAQYRIGDENRIKLQYNAIRSHASGMGSPVHPEQVRAAMLTQLNSYLKAYSGIHPEIIILIKDFLNKDITPVVPEHGGVGASGDLVQLAHIALALIGEGEVWYKGKIVNTSDAIIKAGLKPASVHLREGLSLINGTGFMTGTGVINSLHANNLIAWAVTVAATLNEIVRSFDDYFSAELNQVKLHPGQNKIAGLVRKVLSDSKLTRKREDHFFNNRMKHEYIMADKVQEYYSIRCIPQILGPIYDTAENAEKVLINEANSSSDNPMIDMVNNNIYHGGNFHGDYISFEMDKLKIAIAKLSLLFERQINYLMNNRLNDKLPPFVNLGILGVNFGMQGAVFTATSTAAENQSLAYPNYLHSISNNNDNQDIVSMGTNSAQLAGKVIDNTYQVLAIELLSLAQAIDHLKIAQKMSSFTREKFVQIRKLVPKFEEDTIKYYEVQKIKNYLCTNFLKI